MARDLSGEGDQRGRLTKIRQGLSPAEWARVGGMTAAVIGLNVLGWGMLAAALGGHYHIGKTTVFGVGTGALAYTLGMRHAFDADHVAAIDNTTRKLLSEGKGPLSAGFFFSLGHSSVVFASWPSISPRDALPVPSCASPGSTDRRWCLCRASRVPDPGAWRARYQEKSSSQNSVTPRTGSVRVVSWPRSSTRRILPEIVLGRSANSIRRIRL